MSSEPKTRDQMIRELFSYHDSQIMQHTEALRYHEQMKKHILALAGIEKGEEPSAQVMAIYLGPHKVTDDHLCFIERAHYHGPDPDKFYRPDKGTHWKIDGQCRLMVDSDGNHVNCTLENHR